MLSFPDIVFRYTTHEKNCFLFDPRFFLTSVSLRSETVLLKSGKRLEGNIINQDKETVTFKLADGTTKVFQKSNIRKISFTKIAEPNPKKEETQKNDEKNKKKR